MTLLDLQVLEIAGDTLFRERAIEALDRYWQERRLGVLEKEKDWPVSRNQISTIRQIARQQPHEMAAFAAHQQKRAEAKNYNNRYDDEIAFWKLLAGVCKPRGADPSWALEQYAEETAPPELADPFAGQTKSQLSTEQRQQRSAVKKNRDRWLDVWRRHAYPLFFQHFTAHYLYVATRTKKAATV